MYTGTKQKSKFLVTGEDRKGGLRGRPIDKGNEGNRKMRQAAYARLPMTRKRILLPYL